MDTFVIRMWVPPAGSPPVDDAALRGRVEHIRSGDAREFRDADELVQRLREMSGIATEGHASGETEEVHEVIDTGPGDEGTKEGGAG